ncbi:short-subunit dehydrogenase [Herbihabitans rhizosphaerae]|uniref:Short-subunit dehydrogenase n=1 Tax=Herbihabitans rhizosphaerae TaxID=1872711 RepID=A0A4Q7KR25_9PSEU|nr:SDR family NAD(P)-dependent oxidoreductase [Herbihabitans rhizosphaerae]RZS37792.1 short-subunit dehydrogenase [Herbihabitans rhizosphaerae]
MSHNGKRAAVIGVGPGLGMSIARRFGREGYSVALVSRSADRHPGYLSELAGAGVDATAYAADVFDAEQLTSVLEEIGTLDFAYYGPGSVDPVNRPVPITETDSAAVREAMRGVYPAIDLVGAVLPGMIERGDGALLFAGGLSAVLPMPELGSLAVLSAALRNYVLTLNAGLADTGVYAGTLTIGGLIERGDIHKLVLSQPDLVGGVPLTTLDPDEIADAAWDLVGKRDRAEATFSVFG